MLVTLLLIGLIVIGAIWICSGIFKSKEPKIENTSKQSSEPLPTPQSQQETKTVEQEIAIQDFVNLVQAFSEANGATVTRYLEHIDNLQSDPDKIYTEDNSQTYSAIDAYLFKVDYNESFQAHYENGSAKFRNEIHWTLFLDAAWETGILYHLDWKEPPSHFAICIREILKTKNYKISDINDSLDDLVDSANYEDQESYLNDINLALEKLGYIITEPYEDNDSYLIGIVKTENYDKVQALAEKCNREFITYPRSYPNIN